MIVIVYSLVDHTVGKRLKIICEIFAFCLLLKVVFPGIVRFLLFCFRGEVGYERKP